MIRTDNTSFFDLKTSNITRAFINNNTFQAKRLSFPVGNFNFYILSLEGTISTTSRFEYSQINNNVLFSESRADTIPQLSILQKNTYTSITGTIISNNTNN